MTYIQGFVVAVPAANQAAYVDMADKAWPLFAEFGVARGVEAWADDVPAGKVTDFLRAVQATDDEIVVFGWQEYPSKEVRDAAYGKMMSDPRMGEIGDMPFDGQRMIYAGFVPFIEEGDGRGGYVDGYLLPVHEDKRDAYRDMAQTAAAVFRDHGAVRVVEAWGDDVPDGKVTDYRKAVGAKDGESVVYSWVEWPDKPTRDAGMAKVMEDERMKPDPANMPFDGQRMVYGGFATIFDRP
jgi:uncharacterized protein YbaA (DUF1428 family)